MDSAVFKLWTARLFRKEKGHPHSEGRWEVRAASMHMHTFECIASPLQRVLDEIGEALEGAHGNRWFRWVGR